MYSPAHIHTQAVLLMGAAYLHQRQSSSIFGKPEDRLCSQPDPHLHGLGSTGTRLDSDNSKNVWSGQLVLKLTWTGILQWAPPHRSLRCSSCWACQGSSCTRRPLQTLPFSRLSLQPTHLRRRDVFHKGIHVTSWHSNHNHSKVSHDGEQPYMMSHSRNYFSAITSC